MLALEVLVKRRHRRNGPASISGTGEPGSRHLALPNLFPFDVKILVLTVLAVWMALLCLRAGLTAVELVHHGRTAQAQVVDYRRMKRNGIETSSPIITFTAANGQQVRTELSDFSFGHPIYSEQIIVLYDPGHPKRAVRASDGPDYESVAVYAGLTALLLWFRFRAKRAALVQVTESHARL